MNVKILIILLCYSDIINDKLIVKSKYLDYLYQLIYYFQVFNSLSLLRCFLIIEYYVH